GPFMRPLSFLRVCLAAAGLTAALFAPAASPARAADAVNVYSIWPENYARPMLDAFEKASGISVRFIRFSSGEALARLIAEKSNPRVDVLFGGPVGTFAAGTQPNSVEHHKPSPLPESH